MEKNIYLKDYLASRIIINKKEVNGYGPIYYQNNEKILRDLLSIDFENKNVLSVLSSSDQLLTFRALDSRSVDAFDINRLTIYYYYLRKWSIKYMDKLYPTIDDNIWLQKLLTKVEINSDLEQKALIFFKLHLKQSSNLEKLFYDSSKEKDGETLFRKASSAKKYVDDDLVFYNYNLFSKTNPSINNKYDYIYISNILEWARGDIIKLECAEENLNNLLVNGGTIICSKLINREDCKVLKEKKIFDSNFEFSEFEDKKVYTYKKK